jgi:hypothetical protein
MKSRILLVLLLLLLAASSFTAHASVCNNLTIKGSYAFTIHGSILSPDGSSVPVAGIAKQTFDGDGNLTQVDAVAIGGNLTPGWRPGAGTYSVNPDCTGTQTIVIPGMPDLHVQIVVAQSGNTIHQVVSDPGFATTAEGERVHAPKK